MKLLLLSFRSVVQFLMINRFHDIHCREVRVITNQIDGLTH